ncbi:MAG: MFS transporter, partial [Planctomycetota bacterium]|nr:MFS transporter [Planctomycetota bacterium]
MRDATVASAPKHRTAIFLASFLTLIAAGMGFAIRGGILNDWAAQYGFTKFELGLITGGGLLGFGLVILGASLITDWIGYKAMLLLGFAFHVISAVITLAATPVFDAAGKDAAYWCLWSGMLLFSIGNGLCEAVINPLVATLYPNRKTHYLNILHAGWPGGLVIGAVFAKLFVGAGASVEHLRWEIPMAFFLVPTLIYGIITIKEHFPISEARAAGVTFGRMLAEFASPLLLFLLLLQACVGYVELGTDSWITNITNEIVKGQGLYLFIWASSIMFVLRFFAGPIVEKINPLGLLFISACLGCIGLLL